MKLGLIGRFKPLHNGAYVMLSSICERVDSVIIGIGSSNKYNIRNPFTPKETEKMIRVSLADFSNYSVIYIPDFAHIPEHRDGQRWKEYVKEKFGDLDYFVSSNEYVRHLLKEEYSLLYTVDLIPKEKYVRLRATEVRFEIARYGDWQKLVPEPAAKFLEEYGIIDRFRQEFGLQTLASLVDYSLDESLMEEKFHTLEV